MENFKFIGEWLNEKGVKLNPAFSENLHYMCCEFKKKPRKFKRYLLCTRMLKAEHFLLAITFLQHSDEKINN